MNSDLPNRMFTASDAEKGKANTLQNLTSEESNIGFNLFVDKSAV